MKPMNPPQKIPVIICNIKDFPKEKEDTIPSPDIYE